MWTRADIKSRAKNILKITYWKAFLISLFILFSKEGLSSSGTNFRKNSNERFDLFDFDEKQYALIALAAVAAIILRILIGYLLEVGGRKFFIKAADNDVNMGYVGYFFKAKRYKKVVFGMLLRDILLILWTLLLIIPGIIKSYAYRMVPYILADNPEIGSMRAIELSNKMTKGEKMNIFVLDLSFIGWYLLGGLALGVGVLFVRPYDDSTNAELYLLLRENAINKEVTTGSELNMEAF